MANNNWAVVIGINDYKYHPERRLKYAVRDAQLMHDFLGEHGFQPEQVILCLGDREHQESPTYPTCAYLVNLLARELAPEQVGEVSRFWFFFSGHGVSPDGRDYLLTCDSLAANIEKFALPVDDVIAYLRRHEKAEIVLILDMCRQLVGEKGMDSEIGKQTLAFAKEQSVTTIFSCDYRQSSYENSSLQHGSFTYALVEGLKQHTIPAQLEPYLQQQVRELNRQDHKPVEQKPIIRPEPGAKYLQPLLPECATEADIAALMETAENAELEENYEKAERLFWQVIEITNSRAVRTSAHASLKRIERKKAHIEQSHEVVVSKESEFTQSVSPFTETELTTPPVSCRRPQRNFVKIATEIVLGLIATVLTWWISFIICQLFDFLLIERYPLNNFPWLLFIAIAIDFSVIYFMSHRFSRNWQGYFIVFALIIVIGYAFGKQYPDPNLDVLFSMGAGALYLVVGLPIFLKKFSPTSSRRKTSSNRRGWYRGQISNVQGEQIPIQYPYATRYVQERSFVLLRTDEKGNPLQPLPVIIRAKTISGVLRNGDEVEVRGQLVRGTLYAREVKDLSTGGAYLVIKGAIGHP